MEKKSARRTIAVVVIIVLGLTAFIAITAGKRARGSYAQRKTSLTSAISGSIYDMVRKLTSAAGETRDSMLSQYIQSTLPENKRSGILAALEKLSESRNYELYSVNRYGDKFIKAVFHYTDAQGAAGQIPFLFIQENDRLYLVEVP